GCISAREGAPGRSRISRPRSVLYAVARGGPASTPTARRSSGRRVGRRLLRLPFGEHAAENIEELRGPEGLLQHVGAAQRPHLAGRGGHEAERQVLEAQARDLLLESSAVG